MYKYLCFPHPVLLFTYFISLDKKYYSDTFVSNKRFYIYKFYYLYGVVSLSDYCIYVISHGNVKENIHSGLKTI